MSATAARLESLSKIFSVIVVTWMLCEGPHAIYTASEHPIWTLVKCDDRYFHACNRIFCMQVDKYLTMAEQVTLFIKNVFPFLNTLLLILLLRQLQTPFVALWKRIRNTHRIVREKVCPEQRKV